MTLNPTADIRIFVKAFVIGDVAKGVFAPAAVGNAKNIADGGRVKSVLKTGSRQGTASDCGASACRPCLRFAGMPVCIFKVDNRGIADSTANGWFEPQ